MNRIGPLVERVVARRDDDGQITLSARSPGPAGLADATVAAGAMTIEVDAAEPANLVALRYPMADRNRIEVRHVLTVLFDAAVLDALGRFDPVMPGDEEVVWEGDRLPPDLAAGVIRRLSPRTGGLGRIGWLALVSGELTRVERSALGNGLALAELAGLSRPLVKELQPVPDASILDRAASGHLQRWARALSAGEADDAWVDGVADRHRIQLAAAVEEQERRVRSGDPAVSAVLRDLLARLLEPNRIATSHDSPENLPMAADSSLLDFGADVAAPRVSPESPEAVEHLAIVSSSEPAAGMPAAVTVTIDPVLSGVRDASGEVRDGHLYVEGTGSVDGEAWVRAFAPRPVPTLVAMAPLQVTAIGQWTARALLPTDATTDDLLVDLTATPRRPWRSPPLAAVAHAVDLGARAARAQRRGDGDAGTRWIGTATAWRNAGDLDRAQIADRLAVTAAGTIEPAGAVPLRRTSRSARPTPDDGPAIVDLVD